jgi:hypothetical protein
MEIKESVQNMDTRRCTRPKRGSHTRPPIWRLEHRLSFGFRVPPHIYKKVADLKEGAFRKIERRHHHDLHFWRQIDLGFLLRGRDSEAVFTTIFTGFISIDHELPHHHHM